MEKKLNKIAKNVLPENEMTQEENKIEALEKLIKELIRKTDKKDVRITEMERKIDILEKSLTAAHSAKESISSKSKTKSTKPSKGTSTSISQTSIAQISDVNSKAKNSSDIKIENKYSSKPDYNHKMCKIRLKPQC